MMALGRALHDVHKKLVEEARERRGAEVEVEGEGDGEGDGDGVEEVEREGFVWTPQGVSAHLDDLVRRSALALRRARWLVRLSESAVVWLPRRRRSVERVLVLSGGRVVEVSDRRGGGPPPVPPGGSRRAAERLPGFDLAGVDRMAVLSGELRRLVSLGRGVRVRFSEHALMEEEELRRLFWWL